MTVAVLFGGATILDVPDLYSPTAIFVDTLEAEREQTEQKHNVRYLYRDSATFDVAVEAATGWLEQFRRSLVGLPGECLFWRDANLPDWLFCYDAIFEVRDGVFDTIYHHILARMIGQSTAGKVLACGPADHLIRRALDSELQDRIHHIILAPKPTSSAANGERLERSRLLRGAEMVLSSVMRKMSRLPSQKQRTVLLFKPGGQMTNSSTQSQARISKEDIYSPGMEEVLRRRFEYVSNVFLTLAGSRTTSLKSVLATWRELLSGVNTTWYSYAEPIDFVHLLMDRIKFRRRWSTLCTSQEFRDLFSIGEIKFWSTVAPVLDRMLPFQAASARFHHAIAKRLVWAEGVKVAISVEAYSNLGRSLAHALHRQGGALLGLQGGIITSKIVTNIGFYRPAIGGVPDLEPDEFFVWGPRYKEILMEYGVPADRITVSGFNRRRHQLEIEPRHCNSGILYITSGNEDVCPYLTTQEEDDFNISALLRCKPKQAKVTIRVHPRQDFDHFAKRHLTDDVKVVHGRSTPLHEDLKQADLVVGKASTALLEAVYSGQRILLVNLAGTPEFTGFSQSVPAAPYVETEEGLRKALSTMLDEQSKWPEAEVFQALWISGDISSATAIIVESADRYLNSHA